MKDWYDKGEGSEHMKKEIAQSALKNPVTPAICIWCEHKKKKRRKRVGIIVTDLMGGDASWKVVPEKHFKTVLSFNPIRKFKHSGEEEEKDILDSDKYQEMVSEYFYDKERDECDKHVLEYFFTQTFCPKKIDLSKYNVIGILTLPGG